MGRIREVWVHEYAIESCFLRGLGVPLVREGSTGGSKK